MGLRRGGRIGGKEVEDGGFDWGRAWDRKKTKKGKWGEGREGDEVVGLAGVREWDRHKKLGWMEKTKESNKTLSNMYLFYHSYSDAASSDITYSHPPVEREMKVPNLQKFRTVLDKNFFQKFISTSSCQAIQKEDPKKDNHQKKLLYQSNRLR
ncbi:hypothetical protein ACH5RR_029036 [Cinchona calisaya]|uniref:Uncharacterized protein n=1 Tax=Cinchona calisaya TaxID=153742 RepID=A0ABD2YUE8_9GENT